VEAKNFETYEEMVAWEKELESRIATEVGELPDELGLGVFLSESSGDWAKAALHLLIYAFAKDIHVDSDLVKPAIDFWGPQFFPDSYSFMFAGKWLSPDQIEEIFEFPLIPKTEWPEEVRQQLEAYSRDKVSVDA